MFPLSTIYLTIYLKLLSSMSKGVKNYRGTRIEKPKNWGADSYFGCKKLKTGDPNSNPDFWHLVIIGIECIYIK
jgi:hypothetical protein